MEAHSQRLSTLRRITNIIESDLREIRRHIVEAERTSEWQQYREELNDIDIYVSTINGRVNELATIVQQLHSLAQH